MKTPLNTRSATIKSTPDYGQDGLYLTHEERQVLDMIVSGKSSRQIAQDTRMGRRKTRRAVGNILAEFCVATEVQDALRALYT